MLEKAPGIPTYNILGFLEFHNKESDMLKKKKKKEPRSPERMWGKYVSEEPK